MKTYKHLHPLLPPNLIISPRDGRKYIVPGWVLVDMETSLNDIEWVKEKISKPVINTNSFEFTSSSGKEKYTVRQNGNKLTCNCMGFFRSRGNCKHVKDVKLKLSLKN